MSDTKTPADVAAELTKALAGKIDSLRKMELPQSPDKADGGQISGDSIPSVPKQAGGTTDAEVQKDEVVSVAKAKCPSCGKKTATAHEGASGRKVIGACPSCKKRNVGNVNRMEKAGGPTHVCGYGTCTKGIRGEAEFCAQHREHGSVPEKHKAKIASQDAKMPKEMRDVMSSKKMELPHSPEKATGGQIAEKSELDALDIAQALSKAVVEKIGAVREQLAKMEQLEAAGNAGLKKNLGSLPSDTPSTRQIADGDKNNNIPMPRSVFSLMQKGEGKYLPWAKGAKKPKIGKEVSAEGSGGSDTIKPGPSLKKDALPMPKMPKAPTLKPAGVPGAKAGEAPKAPKAPGAPGMTGNTNKMELPQSSEKAVGGQFSSDSIPSVAKQAGGKTDAEMGKDELREETNIGEESSIEETHMGKDEVMPSSGGVDGEGAPSAGAGMAATKMELPQTSEKADGGQKSGFTIPAMPKQAGGTTLAEMKKDAMGMGGAAAGAPKHPSPVFAAHAAVFGNKAGGAHLQAGGSMGASGVQVTSAMPKLKPAAAGMHTVGASAPTPAGAAPTGGDKTVNMKAPVSKAEMDGAKCPKCHKGMAKCTCY